MKTNRRKLLVALTLLALLCSYIVNAQDKNQTVNSGRGTGATSNLTSVETEELINTFTKKESMLRDLWSQYGYVRESHVQVFGQQGIFSGEYYLLSEFKLDDEGKRIEFVIKAPQPTIYRMGIVITAENKDAFISPQPFLLNAEEKSNYDFAYIGKEKIDELNVHVFDVVPKAIKNEKTLKKMKDRREEGIYFQGRIYVDDQDLQIVKLAGKLVPEFNYRFPKFETYRENVDQLYWFPTYTYGDDLLVFNRHEVPLKMKITYKNYKRLNSK